MSFDRNSLRGRSKKCSFNPFGTGQCLSTVSVGSIIGDGTGFNPFGTGQCLSTQAEEREYRIALVSIPLEQGNVFRPILAEEVEYQGIVSIPLEQGNVFRLQQGVRALCGKASQSHFPTFSDV